jgi:hypothetical protein
VKQDLKFSPSRAMVAIGMALLVLGPNLNTASTRLIGDEGLDVWSHAWGVRWVFNHLSVGAFPWDVAGLAHPRGGTLWYIDPLGALVSLPAQILSGPVLAHNSVLFVQIVLAAAAAMAFARALGGRGWIAAAALATAPTFLAEIHNGTVEACWIGLVPLAGYAATKGRVWAGAAVGLAGLATPYHGVAAALVVGTMLILAPHMHTRKPLRGGLKDAAVAALVAIAIAMPAFLALKANLDDPMGIAKKSTVLLNFPVFKINAVDPIAFFHPGDFWTVDLSGPNTSPFRRTPYLGLSLLALALPLWFKNARARLWLIPIAVTAALALGPFLWHDGDFIRTPGGDLLALPTRALLGLGVALDHPLRFISGAVSLLAVLADVSARKLEYRAPLPGPVFSTVVAVLICFEHLWLAPNVWPLNSADGTIPTVYDALEHDGAVIDLPAARGESIATNRYLYWSGIHRRPIPYSHKVGPDLPTMNPALRTWADLSRNGPRRQNDPGKLRPGERVDRGVEALANDGFRWVVVHPELFANDTVKAAHNHALVEALGPPLQLEGAWVWEIKP